MAQFMTKSSMPIVKWVAEVLGWLMNGIYYVIGLIGLPNVGIAIIIFTIILLMAMMPMQIKQQRFSKLQTLMQPELSKIQAKYKGKKDQVSQQKMMDETNAVYAKYGASPTGSCVQLLIQMPVLFALYQVIYKIPGYITIIGDKIGVVASDVEFVKVFGEFVKETNAANLTRNFADGDYKHVIDAVYALTTKQWAALLKLCEGASFEANLQDVHDYVHRATSFLTLNISDAPWDIIRNAWADRPSMWVLLIIAALAFPILAWFTQWMTYKLMPQPATSGDDNSAMSTTMKSMNTIMPLMSAFFCFTLPVGVGIYWIMSAVIRALQQYFINKKLDQESPEDIINAAQEKMNKKRQKQGLPPQKISSQAHMSTKSFEVEKQEQSQKAAQKAEKTKKAIEESTAYYNDQSPRPGSLASKANMVRAFDEKNSSGKKKK